MRLPTLKFTVKENFPALRGRPNTVGVVAHSLAKEKEKGAIGGVKVVKISKKPSPTKGTKEYFPNAKSRLAPGDVVWIIPHLSSPVFCAKYVGNKAEGNKAEGKNVEKTLLKAFENIYKLDPNNRNSVKVSDSAEHLKHFMKEFRLEDEDFEFEELACDFFEYKQPMAASICTVPFAQKQLRRLMQKFSPSDLEASGLVQRRSLLALDPAGPCRDMNTKARRCEMLALNMRHNFGVSPTAVVHRLDDYDYDLWEVPETTSTILFPNDCLVFLQYPDSAEEIKESMHELNNGVWTWQNQKHSFIDPELHEDYVVWEVGELKKPLGPVPKRPQRRGGKGAQLKKDEKGRVRKMLKDKKIPRDGNKTLVIDRIFNQK